MPTDPTPEQEAERLAGSHGDLCPARHSPVNPCRCEVHERFAAIAAAIRAAEARALKLAWRFLTLYAKDGKDLRCNGCYRLWIRDEMEHMPDCVVPKIEALAAEREKGGK